MKKIIVAITMFVFSSNLMAANLSPYASAKGILGFGSSDMYYPTPIGYGASGALGLNFKIKDTDMRTEFEFSALWHSKTESEDNKPFDKYNSSYDLRTNLYMLNLYADLFKKDRLGLYIGTGMGIANFKERFSDNEYFYGTDINIPSEFHREKSTFAYGIGVGLYFDITKSLVGDTGLRCTHVVVNNKIIICDAMLGLRYNF
ncbi:MAG: outer membrane beta-barrel protein [Alphaproteobacteria bacterium]|nr:outer membrane beta-barrel protein [Alphaproteobacteria bacterium]